MWWKWEEAIEWCKQLSKNAKVVLYLTTYMMILDGEDVIVEEVVAEEAVAEEVA